MLFLKFLSLCLNLPLKEAIETQPRNLSEQEKPPAIAEKTKKKTSN